ncbi:hypothetical protein [Streptomyces galbus]|uniref:Helix-turn-helix domain-containing protein n=1 Tax=Streptomyces galbus TaxID=33898 RepID=A0ABX1IRT0_STRGB|nr:hypothetical protein [Streptomyces galbus]NKQ28289.1 hypothetical protein [Streptomyces galbus]
MTSWSAYRAALARYREDCGKPTLDRIEKRAASLGLDTALPKASVSVLLRGDQKINRNQWSKIEGFLTVCADLGRRQLSEQEINTWKATFDKLHEDGTPPPPPPPLPWKKIIVGLAAVALIIGTAAFIWWPDGGSDSPRLQIVGDCNSVGQVLQSSSSGFTPGGSYTTEVLDPDGQPYTRSDFNPHGTANASGVLGWRWQCDQGDKTGQYRTRVTDDTTGKSTDWVTFNVNAA